MAATATDGDASEVRRLVEDLVATKRNLGFSWGHQERILAKFADHCEAEGDCSADLCRETVDSFLYGSHVRAWTTYKRELALRELGEFARARGHAGAHVCRVGGAPDNRCSAPYVFSDEEVARLFAAIDGHEPSTGCNRTVVDPVLFRVLYGTGMRVSECLALTVGDLDAEAGTLFVRKGKNGRDRLLPVTPRLAATLGRYVAVAHPSGDDGEALFYTRDPRRHMASQQVYVRFREYLLEADIPHFRRGGPKVHSLRHGFAVGCLRRWAREGADLSARLPYLMGYMGHADLRATEYYLRLTTDLHPEVAEAFRLRFGYVIPSPGEGAD